MCRPSWKSNQRIFLKDQNGFLHVLLTKNYSWKFDFLKYENVHFINMYHTYFLDFIINVKKIFLYEKGVTNDSYTDNGTC